MLHRFLDHNAGNDEGIGVVIRKLWLLKQVCYALCNFDASADVKAVRLFYDF